MENFCSPGRPIQMSSGCRLLKKPMQSKRAPECMRKCMMCFVDPFLSQATNYVYYVWSTNVHVCKQWRVEVGLDVHSRLLSLFGYPKLSLNAKFVLYALGLYRCLINAWISRTITSLFCTLLCIKRLTLFYYIIYIFQENAT